MKESILLARMRRGDKLSLKEQLSLIVELSIPAVLAQLSSIIMTYIDASMVGHLGEREGAAIGLVASSTWLLYGLCFACAMGFTVQISHLIGAGKEDEARNLLKVSILVNIIYAIFLTFVICAISPFVPIWLGCDEEIYSDSYHYFLIFALSIPIIQFNNLAGAALQSSGNMKIPSAMQILMGILNVILNYVFIYLLNMGVKGAAIATLISRFMTTVPLVIFLLFKSEMLHLRKDEKIYFKKTYFSNALKIGLPTAFEQAIMTGGQVAFTKIVSPLGQTALSANSFAITAESLCYMPTYGLAAAATTICGQCYGSGQKEMTRRFGWLTTIVGMIFMVISGSLMFVFAGEMIAFISPEIAVIAMGTKILRIEAFCEPFYGASNIASGAMRGTGDTFVPSCYKFFSMWMVRIPLALLLRSKYGLAGIWAAMSVELCVRGILFLIRLSGRKWAER
ncbi:MATE family efflux transporter [Treponema sp. UBA3813]|uniref:MATE family efflux transporter n=1 Tax=Treponema sp. UBA3813 TaxID=1947715 RepID=UPI0025E19D0D|nr:MATE family efflux transporter [Treponema sp. UBA3813]